MVFKWFLNGFLNGLFGPLIVTSRTSTFTFFARLKHLLRTHFVRFKGNIFAENKESSRTFDTLAILGTLILCLYHVFSLQHTHTHTTICSQLMREVGSSTNTVSDESKKKLKELVQKVAASDRLLKQKTGAIVRQVGAPRWMFSRLRPESSFFCISNVLH